MQHIILPGESLGYLRHQRSSTEDVTYFQNISLCIGRVSVQSDINPSTITTPQRSPGPQRDRACPFDQRIFPIGWDLIRDAIPIVVGFGPFSREPDVKVDARVALSPPCHLTDSKNPCVIARSQDPNRELSPR